MSSDSKGDTTGCGIGTRHYTGCRMDNSCCRVVGTPSSPAAPVPLSVKLTDPSRPFPTAEEMLKRTAVAEKEEFKKWEKRVAAAISEHVFAEGRAATVKIPLSISHEDLLAVCKNLQHCGYEVTARDEYGSQILLVQGEGSRRGNNNQPDSVWQVMTDAFDNVEKLLSRKPLHGGGELRIAIPVKKEKKEEEPVVAKQQHASAALASKAINFLTEASVYQLVLLFVLSGVTSAISRISIVHNVVVFAIFVALVYRAHRWFSSITKTEPTAAAAAVTQVSAIDALMQAELRAIRAMRDDVERRAKEVDAAAAAASKKPQEEPQNPQPQQQQQQQSRHTGKTCDCPEHEYK